MLWEGHSGGGRQERPPCEHSSAWELGPGQGAEAGGGSWPVFPLFNPCSRVPRDGLPHPQRCSHVPNDGLPRPLRRASVRVLSPRRTGPRVSEDGPCSGSVYKVRIRT